MTKYALKFLENEQIAIFHVLNVSGMEFYEFEKICSIDEFLADLKTECIIESELLREKKEA